jgi:hypothetical protein
MMSEELNLETCSEQELYSTIDALGAFLWRMNHDLADGRIEGSKGIDDDLVKMKEMQKKAVLQTARFGVTKPVYEDDGPTPEYMKWYRWWDKYFKKTLTDEQWRDFSRRLKDKEDVSMYRPAGEFKDLCKGDFTTGAKVFQKEPFDVGLVVEPFISSDSDDTVAVYFMTSKTLAYPKVTSLTLDNDFAYTMCREELARARKTIKELQSKTSA